MAIREEDPGRRQLPHLPSRGFHGQSIIQHITAGSDRRRPLLARPEIVRLMVECWQKADSPLVGRYCVMPNHVHVFCAPRDAVPFPLKKWVFYRKAAVTRGWPYPDEKPIWQRDFFDR